MADRLAVEISACSGNARRKRLARILGSQTMQNYLASIALDWGHTEAHDLYFNALNDQDIRAFEHLYIDRLDLRECIGRVVAESLKALLDTGTDSSLYLHAFWLPTPRRPWTVIFPHNSSQWSGLLLDTVDSCTVATVTERCLIIKSRSSTFGCKNLLCKCPTGGKHSSSCTHHRGERYQRQEDQLSLLETAMLINTEARMPKALCSNGNQWCFSDLEEGAEFDLGASGRLKFIGPVSHSRGVMMKWAAPTTATAAIQWLQERILRNGRRPCHWEQVLDEEWDTEPVQIHVIS
jgi:hypothetical protein